MSGQAPEMGETSDGYHTFNELYEHRHVLYIALCRAISAFGQPDRVWRSRLHADGTMFKGWFVLGIDEMPGDQITYHLPERLWIATRFATTRARAPRFDGHTPEDVLLRLRRAT